MGGKYPEVIFKAILEPPVVLPQPLWAHMYELVGAQPPPLYACPTFDSLFFPIPPSDDPHDPSAPRAIEHARDVEVVDKNGKTETRKHRNTLYVYKPVYGQVLSELPFSHPKQLVALMPNLRQYALLSTLLKRSFGDGTEAERGATDGMSSEAKKHKQHHAKSGPTEADAMDVDASAEDEGAKSVDVTLTVHPAPRLQVVFPLRSSTANVALEIGPSGRVRVTSQNILPEEDGRGEKEGDESVKEEGKKRFTVEKLGRALEVLEDIDQWCEWIRTRVDSG